MKLSIKKDKIENFDKVIATGSNNTGRYFQYYFKNYPNIIRGNRNGVAVILGNETKNDLKLLLKLLIFSLIFSTIDSR